MAFITKGHNAHAPPSSAPQTAVAPGRSPLNNTAPFSAPRSNGKDHGFANSARIRKLQEQWQAQVQAPALSRRAFPHPVPGSAASTRSQPSPGKSVSRQRAASSGSTSPVDSKNYFPRLDSLSRAAFPSSSAPGPRPKPAEIPGSEDGGSKGLSGEDTSLPALSVKRPAPDDGAPAPKKRILSVGPTASQGAASPGANAALSSPEGLQSSAIAEQLLAQARVESRQMSDELRRLLNTLAQGGRPGRGTPTPPELPSAKDTPTEAGAVVNRAVCSPLKRRVDAPDSSDESDTSIPPRLPVKASTPQRSARHAQRRVLPSSDADEVGDSEGKAGAEEDDDDDSTDTYSLVNEVQNEVAANDAGFALAGRYASDASDEVYREGGTTDPTNASLSVVSKDGAGSRQSPSGALELLMAGDRPYSVWINSAGKALPTGGALLPENYKEVNIPRYPGFTWVCPIRSCRKLYTKLWGLGGHFNAFHRLMELNDNGDGTLSIVGQGTTTNSSGRCPPRIISKRPLDPTEPPMPEPEPVRNPQNRKLFWETGKTAASGPSQPQLTREDQPEKMANKSATWQHVLEFLPKGAKYPQGWAYASLLSLQPRRAVPHTWQQHLSRIQDVRTREFATVLIYVTGVAGLCNNCHASADPFDQCVALPEDAPGELKELVPNCCTCFHHRLDRPCAFVRNRPQSNPASPALAPPVPKPPRAASSMRHSETLAAGSAEPRSRRSSRHAYSHPPEDREEGEQARGHGRRSRRLASLTKEPASISTDTSTSTSPSSADAPFGPRLSPTRTHAHSSAPPNARALELESWELAPGRLGADAYSTSYLSTRQAVAVARDVTFRVEFLRPGTAARWRGEPGRTSTVSVARGKVEVRLGAGAAFGLGENGVVMVRPGVEARFENRLYAEAVLHVTCFADGEGVGDGDGDGDDEG